MKLSKKTLDAFAAVGEGTSVFRQDNGMKSWEKHIHGRKAPKARFEDVDAHQELLAECRRLGWYVSGVPHNPSRVVVGLVPEGEFPPKRILCFHNWKEVREFAKSGGKKRPRQFRRLDTDSKSGT